MALFKNTKEKTEKETLGTTAKSALQNDSKMAVTTTSVKSNARAKKTVATKKPAAKRNPAKEFSAAHSQRLETILNRPKITEKAALMTSDGVYVFEIAPNATKKDVSESIRMIYQVTPRKVHIVRNRPRAFVSRMRGRRGVQSGQKKAYVFLKKGDTIEIL
jgi:ribosomal protein L23